MCLEVNRLRHLRLKPKVAKKDIVCYKVIKYGKTGFFTPFMGMPVDVHECHKKREGLIDPLCKFQEYPYPKTNLGHFINHGIHSWRNVNDAMLNRCSSDEVPSLVLRCIIPKGTRYWIGKEGDYVSETLKIVF